MAIDLGGVLIKLGQFLSIRVDILPQEITKELSGLQDEVSPAPTEKILARIQKAFNRPLSEIFKHFSEKPLGAASLAQAHLVTSFEGKEMVIKVLRPGIESLVETDLAAIAAAIKWLKIFKKIRMRVDLDWLVKEFTSVTINELDLKMEGKNIERFARDFKDNPDVYVPKVYWQYCTDTTLALENVGYIKIDDIEAIESAGITGASVADKLYDIYMSQVFETNFVHVDPHPGNLFVKPLVEFVKNAQDNIDTERDGAIKNLKERPFQIAFIDFGMVSIIPKRLRAAIREYAIGIGTRDAHRVVQSYVNAGAILKGADLKLLVEAHEALFDRFWGVEVGKLREIALSEAGYFFNEYRDIIFEAPFQFQADMLFVARAIGILSGLAMTLNPDFDPWSKTVPFAEKFAKEKIKKDYKKWFKEIESLGQLVVGLPSDLTQFLSHIRRGQISLKTSFSPSARHTIRNIERSIRRLTMAVVSMGLLFCGVILYVTGHSVGLWLLIFIFFLLLVWRSSKDN